MWLPDAMEGPTPVSALIHAATMVTAGVYMVARLAPLYHVSATAMGVVAIVGTATAVMAATIALVQTDIKKVLAYSTVSQLGYMFLACGVGAFGVGVFHLFTHAFFKALLFLGSGSVIHALGGEQDMRKMGGLWRNIPWTFATFLIGTLAIAGIPPFAGFFSKDAILASAFETFNSGKMVLFGLGLLAALLTAFYMSRLLFMTFFGHFRGGHEAEHHVHESPMSMLGPLILLAFGATTVGYFIKIPTSRGAGLPPRPSTGHAVLAADRRDADRGGRHRPRVLSISVFHGPPGTVGAALRSAAARLFEAKYGFDTLYDAFASRVVVGGSEEVLWRGVDVRVIDGAVNGAGAAAAAIARAVRLIQTGLVRAYALLILGGAVAVVGYLLWSR